MTRDDVAPMGEAEPFPCPTCGGGGTLYRGPGRVPASVPCRDCGGSGYGPPPPSLDQTRAHCLRRLAEWAQHSKLQEN